jgi:pimeloyl-ACP methyl ester carboxylesterase
VPLLTTRSQVQLDVTVSGPSQGPLALLLHGFPDAPFTWRYLVPELEAAGFRVAVPAMRGYLPSSGDPTGNYELPALAADCDDIYEQLGGDGRAVLIGHDWGAAIAYVALAASPQRWARGVTMAVPPLPVMAQAFFTFDQLQRSWYMFFFQNALANFVVPADNLAFLDRLWQDWSPAYHDDAHLRAVKEALATPEALQAALGYYRAMFGGNVLSASREDLAPYVAAASATPTQPVLYLHGAEDGCIGADSVGATLSHLAPGSTMHTLANAGHFLHVEAPAEVNALVTRWLA